MAKAKEENAVASGDGVKQRKVISMQQFMPSKEVLAKEVLGKAKGTRYKVGRIFGLATNYREVPTTHPGTGEIFNRTLISGVFRSDVGGKVSRAGTISVTPEYANHVSGLLADEYDGETLKKEGLDAAIVDIELMLESTGNAKAPFRWIVNSNVKTENMDYMSTFDKK